MVNPLDHGEHSEKETLNDGKCSPDGKFFCGGIDRNVAPRELSCCWTWTYLGILGYALRRWSYCGTMGGGSLLTPLFYRLDKDPYGDYKAQPIEAIGKLFCTNGPNWSPDGKKFYMTDSILQEVKEYDYKDGKISNGKVIFDKNDLTGHEVFDGATIDSKGNLWWAICGGGRVM